MQPEWEEALQKQRERVLFAAGQWAAWIQAGAVGDDPPLRSALDNYGAAGPSDWSSRGV